MTSSAWQSQAAPSRLPPRIAAFLAGAVVLLAAAFVSFGTALLAPIGMWALGAYRRRRDDATTRTATWTASIACVAVGLVALTLIAFDSLPSGSVHQIQHAADSVSAASEKRPPPAWVERVAPGTNARAAQQLKTPASLRTPLWIWGAGVTLILMAGIIGSLAWVGGMLCGFAILGRWPNGPAREEPPGAVAGILLAAE
jgi:hypothetical protein